MDGGCERRVVFRARVLILAQSLAKNKCQFPGADASAEQVSIRPYGPPVRRQPRSSGSGALPVPLGDPTVGSMIMNRRTGAVSAAVLACLIAISGCASVGIGAGDPALRCRPHRVRPSSPPTPTPTRRDAHLHPGAGGGRPAESPLGAGSDRSASAALRPALPEPRSGRGGDRLRRRRPLRHDERRVRRACVARSRPRPALRARGRHQPRDVRGRTGRRSPHRGGQEGEDRRRRFLVRLRGQRIRPASSR